MSLLLNNYFGRNMHKMRYFIEKLQKSSSSEGFVSKRPRLWRLHP